MSYECPLWILDEDRVPVQIDGLSDDDYLRWHAFFKQADKRRVALTHLGDVKVSTMFLGVDHGFKDHPVLWETMVFGGPRDQELRRCGGTWADAQAMHDAMVKELET